MMFEDRKQAAEKLAQELESYAGSHPLILALPRGGVILGEVVAEKLKTQLNLILVRKIGHPKHPEYAIGAVVEGEPPIYNAMEAARIDSSWLDEAVTQARKLIAERRELYFESDTERPHVSGRTVIVVDDGMATGLTMEAVVVALQNEGAESVIVAVPVASADSLHTLRALADDVVVLQNPYRFHGSVSAHYRSFNQVDDEQVRRIMRRFKQRSLTGGRRHAVQSS